MSRFIRCQECGYIAGKSVSGRRYCQNEQCKDHLSTVITLTQKEIELIEYIAESLGQDSAESQKDLILATKKATGNA